MVKFTLSIGPFYFSQSRVMKTLATDGKKTYYGQREGEISSGDYVCIGIDLKLRMDKGGKKERPPF
jgi:hypothetical protein